MREPTIYFLDPGTSIDMIEAITRQVVEGALSRREVAERQALEKRNVWIYFLGQHIIT